MIEIWKNIDLKDLEGEYWMPIKGYEDAYHISNMGRIKSIGRQWNGGSNNVIKIKPRIIKLSGDTYLTVKLRGARHAVHILVANTFIPNPERKKTVNHKFFNRKDNRVESLEWATQQEQVQHS